MTSYVIKDVAILDGKPTDIVVKDGVIAEIGKGLSADQTVDGSGCIALPGLVDLHTHLREPGREDAETVLSGSRAAAMGGFTAVHAMANTNPVADTAGVVEQVYRLGKEAGLCDVFPIGAVTQGLNGNKLAELTHDRDGWHNNRCVLKLKANPNSPVTFVANAIPWLHVLRKTNATLKQSYMRTCIVNTNH